MAISPHIARLRAVVGSELLLLPAVTVLPFDEAGRLLLVRHTGSEQWGMVGGTPEPDHDEVASLAWFERRELPRLDLNSFARAALRDTGYLG